MLRRNLLLCLLAVLCLAAQPFASPTQEESRALGPSQTLSQWLEDLPSTQKEEARRILDDVRPRIHQLRRRIEKKMEEIESFSYARGTDPDTLPQLGRELQELRDALVCLIRETRQRMRDEAGITVEMPRSRSYGRVLASPPPLEDVQSAESLPEEKESAAEAGPDGEP